MNHCFPSSTDKPVMSLCINPVCPTPNHPNNHKNRYCQSCGSQLDLLRRYRVMRLLSDKTGFSQVYEAYEQAQPKILKILKQDLSTDTKAVELFRQEANILKQLHHPGIPKNGNYFQYQTRNGLVLHCIAMEKIDGTNLEQWIKQQNITISQEQAIAWLQQLVEILDLVHNKQYLHRDIKPSNIMIRSHLSKGSWGDLVMIDFGTATEIAKISGGMTAIMSSGYSPPEQMNGHAVTQSDFFALGRTFVFLLTGYHPLDIYDVRQNLLNWRNHATQVTPLLLDLIDWLMAAEVEKRPVNAQEILQRLEVIKSQLRTTTTAIVNVENSAKIQQLPLPSAKISPPHKHPVRVALLAIFTVLLVSFGLVCIVGLVVRSPKVYLGKNYGQSPEIKGKIEYFPYQEGKDNQGRIAEFNIAVLSVEYKWYTGSNFQIQYNDQIISLDLLKLNLEQEGIQEIMENPTEIISVGADTCENNVIVSQQRGMYRSQQLQTLAKKLFSNRSSVQGYRLLNLGQFQRSNCQPNKDLTTYQRSVIIIGVKQKSNGVIIDEALRNRLEQKPFADFKLEDYSLGSVDKFKTIPIKL